MRGLTTDDRGAIAVLVAVLLSGGVLLGMGALVVDVGLITGEREQLQSGADAAAYAIAQDCATDDPSCADAGQLALRYAGANARDGVSDADATVCRQDCAAARPAPCPSFPYGLAAAGVAEVRTSTRTDDGGTLLPPMLAEALSGDYPGTTVAACSQVAWGTPAAAAATGIGIALCEWRESTGGDPVNPARTTVDLNQDVPCDSGGATSPPQFTWVGGAECTVDATVGTSVTETTGADCPQILSDARDSAEPLLVPVLDQTGPDGLRVAGLAGFVVTDYRLADDPGDIGSLPMAGCLPAIACLTGYFTTVLVPSNGTLPGDEPGYGATQISRIG
jgi:hypothetical protein